MEDTARQKRKLSDRLKAFTHSTFGKLLRDSLIALLAGIIGYFIPIIVQAYHRRPFAKMWAVLLQDQANAPIVIADVPVDEFSIRRFHTKSRLPTNVPLLGLQDALGVSALTNALADGSPNWAPELHAAEDSRVQMSHFTFVSIGGPSVNEATYELIASCEEVANEGRGKAILHRGTLLDSKLMIFYPSHEAEDFSSTGPMAYIAGKDDSRLREDYGFIEIGPSPYAPGHYAVVVFGLWPPGTQAAVEALIHPDTTSDKGKLMQSMIRNHQPLVAVVKTQVTSISTQGTPALVNVRPLERLKDTDLVDQPCTPPSKRKQANNVRLIDGYALQNGAFSAL